MDVLLKKYPVEESKWIINFMGQTSFKYTEMIEKSIYGKDTWYAFENIKLLGPEKYDQYLKSLYGDYMTPVRGGADHDYPFYAKQEKLLREYLEKETKEDHADI